MSDVRPRINPRHRTTDVERLAAAILDLASVADGDEEELQLGAQIHAMVAGSVAKTAPVEKSA